MKVVSKEERKEIVGGFTYTVKCSQCSWTYSQNYYEFIGWVLAIGQANQYNTNHEAIHCPTTW